MSRNKVYAKIGLKNGRLEFHVSATKQDAIDMQAMSKAIKLDADPIAVQASYNGMVEQVKLHGLVLVV